jgi:hypothetical protein
MPPRKEVEDSIALVEAARERLKGELVIDMVIPDYYARYPKPCGGGGSRSTFRRPAKRFLAMRPSRFRASNSGTCAITAAPPFSLWEKVVGDRASGRTPVLSDGLWPIG